MTINKLFKGSYGENLIKKSKRKNNKQDEYELSYSYNCKSNLEDMFDEEVREYTKYNYFTNEKIIFNNLQKDLLAFKLYKEDIKLKMSADKNVLSFLSVTGTVLSPLITLYSYKNNVENKSITFWEYILRHSEKDIYLDTFFIISVIFVLLIYFIDFKRLDEKLNCLNYSINILEAIKEDLYFVRDEESKEYEYRYRVDYLSSLNSFKENKSDGILESKNMQRDKRLASNFSKEEHENSLVSKASKISFLILFLFHMKKRMNDKK